MTLSLLVISLIVCVAVGAGATLWDHLGKVHDEIEQDTLHRH